jgi:hypothetical protein
LKIFLKKNLFRLSHRKVSLEVPAYVLVASTMTARTSARLRSDDAGATPPRAVRIAPGASQSLHTGFLRCRSAAGHRIRHRGRLRAHGAATGQRRAGSRPGARRCHPIHDRRGRGGLRIDRGPVRPGDAGRTSAGSPSGARASAGGWRTTCAGRRRDVCGPAGSLNPAVGDAMRTTWKSSWRPQNAPAWARFTSYTLRVERWREVDSTLNIKSRSVVGGK